MQKSVEFKGKKKKLRKICAVQSILSICVLLLLLDHEFDHLEDALLCILWKFVQFLRKLIRFILRSVCKNVTKDGISRYLKSVQQQYKVFAAGKGGTSF